VEDLIGVYPAGWNATNVGELCNAAFNKLNTFVQRFYDIDIISATDASWTDIENELVVQMIHRANALHMGKDVLPTLFTKELIEMIHAAITDTTYDGAYYIPLQGSESDT